MNSRLNLFRTGLFAAMVLCMASSSSRADAVVGRLAPRAPSGGKTSEAISWSQIGAKAGTDYKGDGLAVIPTANGARLRCVFQRLEAEVTREGLWLISTVTNAVTDRFRVMATEMGRAKTVAQPSRLRVNGASPPPPTSRDETSSELAGEDACATSQLSLTGTVQVADKVVRFLRPGLTEEYSVSMDGVQQDFIIERPPPINHQLSTINQRTGELMVQLEVTGARVEPAVEGARLVLESSGRKIAYSRLRVTDATGKELTARMDVQSSADFQSAVSRVCNPQMNDPAQHVRTGHVLPIENRRYSRLKTCATSLAVLVDDADAVYPVRIDPTFSDANWISMGGIPGANNPVYAAVVDSSGNLYIGGSFTSIGDVIANRVAKWNGSSWSALGSGVDSSVRAIALSGNDVYAGGDFLWAGGNVASRIARWNGTNWSSLGSGMNNKVSALALSDGNLYVGGSFTTATNSGSVAVTVNRLAKWDGTNWGTLGFGLNNTVFALAASGSDLYAGGAFTTAGGSAANRIAKWNGSTWMALGAGMNTNVNALAVSGSDLYSGGDFTTAGSSAANYIAKWNGSTWTNLGSGMNLRGYVRALAVSGSNVYAGGDFTTADGSTASRVAKWNGSNWSALGLGMDGAFPTVYVLAVSGSDVYPGGSFGTAGGSAANRIARWNGSSWSALGSGMNDSVYALAVSGGDIYAGGSFMTAGGVNIGYGIARWNGSSWSALGSGMNSYVEALAVLGSDLYAGGAFTKAGGSTANYIAKWDGSSWSALGSGTDLSVAALAVSGSDVYAGGRFTSAGGNAANYIAKWDGSSWSALGSGMGGGTYPFVYALAVSGSDVYAGGAFAIAGGINIGYGIARWNGSTWSALGSGLGGPDGSFPNVYALAVSGSDLYVGGAFTTAGGNAANYIAKWDGSSWSALGSGTDLSVAALAVSDNDVYVGGNFFTAGGNAAHFIAKWNGTNWSALGSGMNYGVNALVLTGSDLYAGGGFTVAGGKVSGYIARAYLPGLPVLSVLPSDSSFKISWPSPDTDGFLLEQTDTLPPPANWITNSASVTDDGTNKSVTLPATNSPQFFRLRRP